MSYAQQSYPNVPLGDGSCGLSLAQAGCYVTADSMLLTWSGHPIDPPALNAEYLAKGLFQGGCLISSDTLPRARPSQFALDRIWDSPTDPAPLDLCDPGPDGLPPASSWPLSDHAASQGFQVGHALIFLAALRAGLRATLDLQGPRLLRR